MGIADYLKSVGLTNSDTADIGDLVGFERKIVKQTLCSSYTCQGSGYRPRIVSDIHISKCPYCKSENHLFYKTTSIQLPQIGGKQWALI